MAAAFIWARVKLLVTGSGVGGFITGGFSGSGVTGGFSGVTGGTTGGLFAGVELPASTFKPGIMVAKPGNWLLL